MPSGASALADRPWLRCSGPRESVFNGDRAPRSLSSFHSTTILNTNPLPPQGLSPLLETHQRSTGRFAMDRGRNPGPACSPVTSSSSLSSPSSTKSFHTAPLPPGDRQAEGEGSVSAVLSPSLYPPNVRETQARVRQNTPHCKQQEVQRFLRPSPTISSRGACTAAVAHTRGGSPGQHRSRRRLFCSPDSCRSSTALRNQCDPPIGKDGNAHVHRPSFRMELVSRHLLLHAAASSAMVEKVQLAVPHLLRRYPPPSRSVSGSQDNTLRHLDAGHVRLSHQPPQVSLDPHASSRASGDDYRFGSVCVDCPRGKEAAGHSKSSSDFVQGRKKLPSCAKDCSREFPGSGSVYVTRCPTMPAEMPPPVSRSVGPDRRIACSSSTRKIRFGRVTVVGLPVPRRLCEDAAVSPVFPLFDDGCVSVGPRSRLLQHLGADVAASQPDLENAHHRSRITGGARGSGFLSPTRLGRVATHGLDGGARCSGKMEVSLSRSPSTSVAAMEIGSSSRCHPVPDLDIDQSERSRRPFPGYAQHRLLARPSSTRESVENLWEADRGRRSFSTISRVPPLHRSLAGSRGVGDRLAVSRLVDVSGRTRLDVPASGADRSSRSPASAASRVRLHPDRPALAIRVLVAARGIRRNAQPGLAVRRWSAVEFPAMDDPAKISPSRRLSVGGAVLRPNGRRIPHSLTEGVSGPLRATVDRLTGSSLAPATHETYTNSWRSFLRFCDLHHRNPLPASAHTLVLFVAFCFDRPQPLAPTTVAGYISAVRAVHVRQGLPPPAIDDNLLSLALRGYRREYKSVAVALKPLRTRIPLRATTLAHILASVLLLADSCPLPLLRACAAVSLGFLFFCRAASLVNIRAADFELSTRDGMPFARVRLTHLKNSLAPAPLVLLFRPGGLFAFIACQFWFRWLARRPAEDLLFALSAAEASSMTASPSTSVSAWLQQLLVRVQVHLQDHEFLASHSLRKGGATSAFLAGMSLDAIRHRGHWAAEKSFVDTYVDRSEEATQADLDLWSGMLPPGAPVGR